jgi:hypothetical protein
MSLEPMFARTVDTNLATDLERSQEMVRRGRFATKVAIVFTVVVAIATPVIAGMA